MILFFCLKCAEPSLNEYEKQRAANMMKNNQLFQRLGLGQLKTMMTTIRSNNKEDGSHESGSLYSGDSSDGSDQEEASKAARTKISNIGGPCTKGSRANKRVVEPEAQEQPFRVTRQRIAAANQESCQGLTPSTQPISNAATNLESSPTLDDAIEPTSLASLAQAEGDDQGTGEQGKCHVGAPLQPKISGSGDAAGGGR